MHNVFSKRALRAIGRGTPDTVCTSHDAIFLNARCARSRTGDGPRLYLYLYLCFGCVLCFVFCVFWPFWAESVFCVFVFWPCWGGLCFVFSCFGAAGREISTPGVATGTENPTGVLGCKKGSKRGVSNTL
jgi:hypothetical protein